MRLRVYIIDDQEEVRNFLKTYIELLGHEVLVAEGPQASGIFHECNCCQPYACCDIVIVDYHMPEMTGLEFLEQMHLRGCKINPTHKFILTGNVLDVDAQSRRKIGCGILEKPVELSAIKEIIDQVVELTPKDRKLIDLATRSCKPYVEGKWNSGMGRY